MTPLDAFVQQRQTAPGLLAASRDDLARLLAAMGATTGAEIGVWTGDYSKRLCERIPGLQLRCVDPWESYARYEDKKNDRARLEEAYRTACAQLEPFGCTIIRQHSLTAARGVPNESLDFVYLDGNHGREFVAADLEAWVPKVKRGGIVAGHDYVTMATKPWLQVKPAVDAFVHQHGIAPLYVLTADKSPSFFWQVR